MLPPGLYNNLIITTREPMKRKKLITRAATFVQKALKDAETGHDWHHVERVMTNARKIMKKEKCNKKIVRLGVLFHDIADPKFHEGNDKKGPALTKAFLKEMGEPPGVIDQVVAIIRNVSWKGGLEKVEDPSIEFQIVQDADRLDAMGAIGIARAFNYGGYTGRKIFDPGIKIKEYKSETEYRESPAPTINHFYEKLLNLKDRMNTKKGKKMAKKRHQFMVDYLDQFNKEMKGKA